MSTNKKQIRKKSKLDPEENTQKQRENAYFQHYMTYHMMNHLNGDTPIFTERFIKERPREAAKLKSAFLKSNISGFFHVGTKPSAIFKYKNKKKK